MTAGKKFRDSDRRHLRIPLKILVASDDPEGQIEWAINLSPGGLGLQAKVSRRPGERLRLRFRLSPTDPLLEVEAEVAWCTKESDLTMGMHYFETGFSFVSLSSETQEAITAFVESDAHFWPDEDTLTEF